MWSLNSSFRLTVALAIASSLAACHSPTTTKPIVVNPGNTNGSSGIEIMSAAKPNEAGEIPILEYHNLTVRATGLSTYEYPASEFKQDMEWLYAHNYRPVSLDDYVRGWIDVPAGMSPVVITFDDALSGQFRYLADGSIDPQCAVGILNSMHAEHPDWQNRATFFVLTDGDPKMPAPFTVPDVPGTPKQRPFARKKMDYLVSDGFEIGNHTMHHSLKLKAMSPVMVQAEFAGGVYGIHKYLPKYQVDTLALPYGIFPTDLSLLAAGRAANGAYANICAMAAGWEPAPSPMSVFFRPYRIPRIIPSNNRTKPGGRYTIRYWLAQLEKYPQDRFVSDGNPVVYTIPISERKTIDLAQLKSRHFDLRLYSGKRSISIN